MTTATATTRCLEVGVTCGHDAVEIVAALFADHGLNQGVVIEEPFIQDDSDDDVRVDPSRPVMVRTFLDAADTVEETIDEIRQILSDLGGEHDIGNLFVRTLTVHKHEDEDWGTAWVAYSSMTPVGRRVVVRAPWYDYEPEPGEIVLALDPGLSFGSGGHGSTRLAMMALEDDVFPGARVLDVGTGSGILAVGAALLGAGGVDAVDIDPVAISVARETAERNGVADIVRIAQGSVGPGEPFQGESYDLVVANNPARIQLALASSMTQAVRAGGTLILSGIADFREASVREAFEALGLRLVRRELDRWLLLVWRRPLD